MHGKQRATHQSMTNEDGVVNNFPLYQSHSHNISRAQWMRSINYPIIYQSFVAVNSFGMHESKVREIP